MVEVNFKRTFSSGEWGKGAVIRDNVIIVEKVGCNKNEQKGKEKPYNLFYFYQHDIFTNCSTYTNLINKNVYCLFFLFFLV